MRFLKGYINKTKDFDNIFYINNIALLYVEIDENDTDDCEDYFGCYPGPINNFFLLKGSIFWKDPIEDYSNKFLKKNILEGKDFKILPDFVYEKIKEIFGVYEEIERRSFESNNESFIDIHLEKVFSFFIYK